MFLGITWLGWIMLVLAYVPVVALLIWMARKRGVRNTAFISTAIVTAIPFGAAIAEAAYVEHNWRALCASAKTEIKRKVVVEGFYDDGFRTHGWTILQGGKNGFRFVEWKDGNGRIWRTEGFNTEKLETRPLDKPTARYHWKMQPFSAPVGHLLKKREDSVIDSETGEVIAASVEGYRYPAFVDRIWWHLFDAPPQSCGQRRDIWSETLVGVDRKE